MPIFSTIGQTERKLQIRKFAGGGKKKKPGWVMGRWWLGGGVGRQGE